jgi:hypothetical protein
MEIYKTIPVLLIYELYEIFSILQILPQPNPVQIEMSL